jgi:hypothetical protein
MHTEQAVSIKTHQQKASAQQQRAGQKTNPLQVTQPDAAGTLHLLFGSTAAMPIACIGGNINHHQVCKVASIAFTYWLAQIIYEPK